VEGIGTPEGGEVSEHKVVVKTGSTPDTMGYMDWRQNVCLCGWKGRKHFNYENYAYTNCSDEEQQHLRQHKKVLR